MQTYRELRVWQKSIALVKSVYKLTKTFPKAEMFGLSSQMRRAAVSIPANIAEGYVRKYRPEYLQFLRIAFGSGAELETFAILTKELGLANEKEVELFQDQLNEVMRMLNGLISSLVAKP